MENRINTLFYDESKILRLRMVKKENRFGWVYGSMYQGEDYLCDTLEVAGSQEIALGEYFIRPAIETISGREYIAVEDQVGDEVTKIIWKNTEYNNKIECRLTENHIAVGSRINEPNLVTREYLFNILRRFILATNLAGKRVILTVERYENYKETLDSPNVQEKTH